MKQVSATEAPSQSSPKSITEATGYIGGVFAAILQAIMPLRMWVILVASVVLLTNVYNTESLLSIGRAIAVYIVVVAVMIGSAVFQRR